MTFCSIGPTIRPLTQNKRIRKWTGRMTRYVNDWLDDMTDCTNEKNLKRQGCMFRFVNIRWIAIAFTNNQKAKELNQYSPSGWDRVSELSKHTEVSQEATPPPCTQSPKPDRQRSSSPASVPFQQTTHKKRQTNQPRQSACPQSHQSSARSSRHHGRWTEGACDQ